MGPTQWLLWSASKATAAPVTAWATRIRFSGVKVEGNICIHALCGLLPTVLAMRYGAQFPWLENPDVSVHACPDAQNPVVFELRRLRK